MPVLYEVQKQMGRQTGSAWVPRVAMDAVAVRLNMAPIRVYEVATFYLMFNTDPIGRYHLQVCVTTPCWLRGSDDVEAACRRVTGIKGWQRDQRGRHVHHEPRWSAWACVNAPVLQVDDDYYEDMDGPAVERLLAWHSPGASGRSPAASPAGRPPPPRAARRRC